MKLIGAADQARRDFTFDASGTITAGGASQLLLPERKSCSFLSIVNISDTTMYLEIGSARASCTISNGAVNSVTVTNGGFGFTYPPGIEFLGGGPNVFFNPLIKSNAGAAAIYGFPAPSRPARAHAVLGGGVVTSIVIDDGGSGYLIAPFVHMANDPRDPYGCADPFFNSTNSGYPLSPGFGSYYNNGTVCTTDPISVFCASSAKPFTVKWMS